MKKELPLSTRTCLMLLEPSNGPKNLGTESVNQCMHSSFLLTMGRYSLQVYLIKVICMEPVEKVHFLSWGGEHRYTCTLRSYKLMRRVNNVECSVCFCDKKLRAIQFVKKNNDK